MREHDDTKSKQDDKACGKSANPAPRDMNAVVRPGKRLGNAHPPRLARRHMHDARDFLVDERDEVAARDEELALVFGNRAIRGKLRTRGAFAADLRERVGVNRLDEPAALDKAPRRGAGVPELIDALPFQQFA